MRNLITAFLGLVLAAGLLPSRAAALLLLAPLILLILATGYLLKGAR